MQTYDWVYNGSKHSYFIPDGAEPILGNAMGRLRDDLLSYCYNCGAMIPTKEVPAKVFTHIGWRHPCPQCLDIMNAYSKVPEDIESLLKVKYVWKPGYIKHTFPWNPIYFNKWE